MRQHTSTAGAVRPHGSRALASFAAVALALPLSALLSSSAYAADSTAPVVTVKPAKLVKPAVTPAFVGPVAPASLKVAGPIAPATTAKAPKKAPKTKAPKKTAGKKGAASTTGCTEDSFLNSASPASGSAVDSGSTVSVVYSDESPLNTGGTPGRNGVTATAPTLTISPNDVAVPTIDKTPLATGPDKYNVKLSFKVPAATGVHTFTLKAYDGDQNKQGGDCGIASWTLTVNPPNNPPNNPPTTGGGGGPAQTPPVISNGGTPQPVQGPRAPVAKPVKAPVTTPATGLPFTGSHTKSLGTTGALLVLVGTGLVLAGRKPAYAIA
jgi:hypothetical protein